MPLPMSRFRRSVIEFGLRHPQLTATLRALKWLGVPPKGRPATPGERAILLGWFPALTDFSITDGQARDYNCVGWTVGRRAFICGPSHIRALDGFYSLFSRTFQTSPPGVGQDAVALYCTNQEWKHVALRLPGYDDWWESKLGPSFRIVHRLKDLEGVQYGRVIGFYV